MAEFHFVEDYERHVQALIAAHPFDEAMSLAVGGAYEIVGEIERDLLRYAGLRDGMALVDLGCGSGRLASALGRSMRIDYLGTDIVQALLDYAASRTPPVTGSFSIANCRCRRPTRRPTLSADSASSRTCCTRRAISTWKMQSAYCGRAGRSCSPFWNSLNRAIGSSFRETLKHSACISALFPRLMLSSSARPSTAGRRTSGMASRHISEQPKPHGMASRSARRLPF